MSSEQEIISHWQKFIPLILVVIVCLVMVTQLSTTEGDEGGTDADIRVLGEAGRGVGQGWRTIHGFVIIENHEKDDNAFNITICEDIKWRQDEKKYVPSGHVYGALTDIYWDDNPEPSHNITLDEFDDYREDELNLTVYILGEYYRQNGNETELRQAFKEITLKRPMEAPIPMMKIAFDDNWTWQYITENDVISIPRPDVPMVLHINTSGTIDPDGDNIITWSIIDASDGSYLYDSDKQPLNETISFPIKENNRYFFGCKDVTGSISMMSFYIEMTTDHLEPNLSYMGYSVSKNPIVFKEDIYINVTIGNTGDREARYVDVYFILDGEFQYYKTIDMISPGENATISFLFTEDVFGIYEISFDLRDDGVRFYNLSGIYIAVGTGIPFLYIESHDDISIANISDTISGTVSFEGLLDEVMIEISIDGGPWGWVTNSTEKKYWSFTIPDDALTNDSHTVQIRAFDGIFYSENKTLYFTNEKEESSVESSSSTSNAPILIAGGVVLFGTMGFLGLVYGREEFRFLLHTLLFTPLYSKLRKDNIVKEGNREDIYHLILSKPGTNLSALRRELDIGHGTLIHHLTVLEQNHWIFSKKEFGRRMFFPTASNGFQSTTSPTVHYELSITQKSVIDHLRLNGPKA